MAFFGFPKRMEPESYTLPKEFPYHPFRPLKGVGCNQFLPTGPPSRFGHPSHTKSSGPPPGPDGAKKLRLATRSVFVRPLSVPAGFHGGLPSAPIKFISWPTAPFALERSFNLQRPNFLPHRPGPIFEEGTKADEFGAHPQFHADTPNTLT